jgi:hypothetical protein
MYSTVSTAPSLAFLAGPWLFIALALSGPFLVMLLVLVAAAILPALLIAPLVLFSRLPRRAPSFVLRPAAA